MKLRYGIRANHGGFIKCRICIDPDNMSEECFNQHVLKTCAPALRSLHCRCAMFPAAASMRYSIVAATTIVNLSAPMFIT